MMIDISTFVKDSGRHAKDDLRHRLGLTLSHPFDLVRQNQWIRQNLISGLDECVRNGLDVNLLELAKIMSSDKFYCKMSPFVLLNTFDEKLAFKLFSRNNLDPSLLCPFQKFMPETYKMNYETSYKKAKYLEEVKDKIVNGFHTQCGRIIYYKESPLRREQVGDVYIMVKLLAYFQSKQKLDVCICKQDESKWQVLPSNAYSTEGLVQELIDGNFVIKVHSERLQSCNDPNSDTQRTRFLLAFLEWIEWRFGAFVYFDNTSLNSQAIYIINDIRKNEDIVDLIAILSYWMWTQFCNLDIGQCSKFLDGFHFKVPIAVNLEDNYRKVEILKKMRSLPDNKSKPNSFKLNCELIDTIPVNNPEKGTLLRLINIIKFNQESVSDHLEVKELVDLCMSSVMLLNNSERGAGQRTISASESLGADFSSAPEINANEGSALMAPITPEIQSTASKDEISGTTKAIIWVSSITAGILALWGTGLLRDFITMTGAEKLPIIGKGLAWIADTGDLRRQKYATPLLNKFSGQYNDSIYDNLYTEFRKTGYIKINRVKLKIQDFDMLGTAIHLKIDDCHYYATSFDYTEEGTIRLYCAAAVKNEFGKYTVVEQPVDTLSVVESSLIKMAKG